MLCMKNSKILVFDSELESEIASKYHDAQDVFSLENQGQKVWIKKAKKSGSNWLQRLAYKIIKNPLLTPAQEQTAEESIDFEASKIKTVKNKFENVPDIIHSSSSFMVMLDSGKDLRSLIKQNEKDESEIIDILNRALSLLADFHNLGYYHGGSQIKNFTYKDNKLCMIDFEERFDKVDVKSLQFRDLFLFLISIARTEIPIDYKELISKYIEMTSNKDFLQRFKTVIKDLGFLTNILRYEPILNKMGKDAKSVYKLIKEIENI